MDFDLSSATLVGLAIIGAVNAATIFKPDLDSRAKFLLSLVVALLIGFIPAELGNEILNRITVALAAAFASSGGYKLTQVIGNNVPRRVI